MPSWDSNPFDPSANPDNYDNNGKNPGGASITRGGNATGAAMQQSTPGNVTEPSLQLPKAGGAIRGIDEKFAVNAINGTASCSIPLPLSPSRMGFTPPIGLNYSSGNGNGPFGLGWQLSVASIARRTRNFLPRYEDALESDIFQLSDSEDLVPLLTQGPTGWTRLQGSRVDGGINYTVFSYRPRIEQGFSRIERWVNTATSETHWRIQSAANTISYFGLTAQSRVSDPNDPARVFEWLLCQTQDDKGSIALINYKTEDGVGIPSSPAERNRPGNCTQVYLSSIWYGNIKPYYTGDPLPGEGQFLFRTLFDYGEHDASIPIPANIYQQIQPWTCRKDPFSSFRSGFDIRTYRRCSRVLMFHCFPQKELPVDPYLISSLNLQYDDDLSLLGNGDSVSGFSFLVKATQNGHIWDPVTNTYTTKSLPDQDFEYQQHAWNVQVQDLTAENLSGAPVGVDNKGYQWVDLFSEGIPGILTEQSDAWYYKSNLGAGAFTPAMSLEPIPSFRGLNTGTLSIRELEGDGIKYLVKEGPAPQGFFKLGGRGETGSVGGVLGTGETGGTGGAGTGGWKGMRYFEGYPTLDPMDPNARRLDLNEDGREDILYAEDGQFRWYESLGERGFRVGGTVPKALDEEKGPAIVFADADQSIFLADMSGDGLADIVRIRNGEVCYWPNLGYGRFGCKVGMGQAPVFDTPDGFDPDALRLADIDGSGTADLVYLGRDDFRVWMNLSGNAWSTTPEIIDPFPATDNRSDIDVLDFLGTGTASIVCSSPFSKQPLRYIDLMGSRKPALLTSYKNNCGKETVLEYLSSTSYYLADKQAGIPWITRLPFPVQCLSKVTSTDLVRESVFVNTYSYRHGFYDPYDKEFRGFARVERLDTESFGQFVLNASKNVVEQDLFQPPVRVVSWYHTGAFLPDGDLVTALSKEYFQNTGFAEYAMPGPALPAIAPDDMHEAFRTFKGLPLRMEVYSNDGSTLQELPYSASQSNVSVRMLQPKGANRYATFLVLPAETISYGYERTPADPRISHSFVLAADIYGNITNAATLVYPRVARPTGPLAIPDTVWNQQNQLHLSTNETDYTNDIIQPDTYRLRIACDTRSYEINGLVQPSSFYFTLQQLATAIAGAATILYEQDFTAGVQRRLYRHKRAYLSKDDLSGPLPLGALSNLGILYNNNALAFTAGLVTKYYGSKLTGAMLSSAMYIHSEGDSDWWTQSSLLIYPASPAACFYLPEGVKDVYGNVNSRKYDDYFLLPVSTTDALSNSFVAVNDYRTLSPSLLTDPNLNRSAVRTDELGLPIAMAVMGKLGSTDGDTLADPTVKLDYDLLNWQNNGQPNFTHLMAREIHGPTNTRWQESYAYTDGFGSVIMMKKQAPAGTAGVWNPVTHQVDQVNADPRWIGTGRSILNNKGNIVKRYEPYFSTNFDYETESALVATGVTSIYYYDPLGRNNLITHPDGTLEKIEFDCWINKIYDPNDTVKSAPWYIQRGSPDPTGPEPTDPDRRAAWLAAMDDNTPTVAHLDNLGSAFYAIGDYGGGITAATYTLTDLAHRYSQAFDQLNRNIFQSFTNLLGQTIYLKSAEKGERWNFSDVLGRVTKLWDNDIDEYRNSYDALNRPVSSYLKQGGKEFVFSRVVYGDLILPVTTGQALNLRGKVYQLFDQSGAATVDSVDFAGNVTGASRRLCIDYKNAADWTTLDGLTDTGAIQTAADLLLETETFSYTAELDALNRPVQVILPDGSQLNPVYDTGGTLATLSANIMGSATATDFLLSQEYDAKGQRQSAQFGNNTVTNYFYDPDNFRLINLVTRQKQTDPASQALQNLRYYSDPVGNITQIRDDAQQTRYFRNAVVYPENKYTYDALYQLTSATGREHAGLGMDTQRNNADIPSFSPIPEANDATAVRNFSENYSYDLCGNLLSLQHSATGAGWTQRYKYQYQANPADNTNRLAATSMPGDAPGTFSGLYAYDGGVDDGLHGNMTSMPALSAAGSLSWNFLDQLSSVNLGGGGMAYYVNGPGGRARKVIERPGGKILDRIYLGSVEIYRERQGTGAPTLERYTLHISDNTGRIAQVDTKTVDTNNSDPGNILDTPVIRYQYTNHLGSAMLETDSRGAILSYEEYHPFGTSSYRSNQAGSDISLKRYRFCGKERDEETGFYAYGARYYAPWLGRWTSSDPAGFKAGLNMYVYCSNNPVMFHDPNGMDDDEVTFSLSGKPEDIKKAQSDPSAAAGAKYEAWVRSHPTFTVNGVTGRLREGTGKLTWSEGHWMILGAQADIISDTDEGSTDENAGGGAAKDAKDAGTGDQGAGGDKGADSKAAAGQGDGGTGAGPTDNGSQDGTGKDESQKDGGDAGSTSSEANPKAEQGTGKGQGDSWWPSWLPRPDGATAGQGTVTTWDTAQRSKYMAKNRAGSDAAQKAIQDARTAGDDAAAVQEAKNVSDARNATRELTQEKLSPGGRDLSKAIEGERDWATMWETYSKRLPGVEGGGAAATEDAGEIARRIAVAAGESRGGLKALTKFGKVAGPVGIALGVGIGIYDIATAPEGQRGRVAARETGSFAGGLLGASLGTTAGVALAGGISGFLIGLGLISGPIGWLAIGLGIIGAIAGAWAFGKLFGSASEATYDAVAN